MGISMIFSQIRWFDLEEHLQETMDLSHQARGFLSFFSSALQKRRNTSCSQFPTQKNPAGCKIGYSIMDTVTKKDQNGNFEHLEWILLSGLIVRNHFPISPDVSSNWPREDTTLRVLMGPQDFRTWGYTSTPRKLTHKMRGVQSRLLHGFSEPKHFASCRALSQVGVWFLQFWRCRKRGKTEQKLMQSTKMGVWK